MGYDDGCLLVEIVKEDTRRADLTINWDKNDDKSKHERRYYASLKSEARQTLPEEDRINRSLRQHNPIVEWHHRVDQGI